MIYLENFDNRGEKRAFGFLEEGLFRPYRVSKDVAELFETRSAELGLLILLIKR